METIVIVWSAFLLTLPLIISTPKTTVVLLDNESSHNAVVVSTNEGNVTVDQPYSYTTLSSLDKQPSSVKQADPEEVRKKYGEQLNSLPTPPVSMLFYFEPATATLTESSKNQVAELIRVIGIRSPAAVDIIGHSDRAGDADQNYALALERAKEVEQYLLDANVSMERRLVRSHGESDPIVPTADGVDEPQNRRVEVIVR